jgi:ArsR family transcriptional regulator
LPPKPYDCGALQTTDGEHLAKSGEQDLAFWLSVPWTNMTATAQARYQNQARIIKALAHPTRLFIVEELARGERCVCELTDLIGVEMPTVSRHLSQLKRVGILADEKRGSLVYYRAEQWLRPMTRGKFLCPQI